MMGHRERMISGDEVDCFTARRLYGDFDRPGVARKTKARFNRRIRKDAKSAVQEEARMSPYDEMRALTEEIEIGIAFKAYFGQTFDKDHGAVA